MMFRFQVQFCTQWFHPPCPIMQCMLLVKSIVSQISFLDILNGSGWERLLVHWLGNGVFLLNVHFQVWLGCRTVRAELTVELHSLMDCLFVHLQTLLRLELLITDFTKETGGGDSWSVGEDGGSWEVRWLAVAGVTLQRIATPERNKLKQFPRYV